MGNATQLTRGRKRRPQKFDPTRFNQDLSLLPTEAKTGSDTGMGLQNTRCCETHASATASANQTVPNVDSKHGDGAALSLLGHLANPGSPMTKPRSNVSGAKRNG